MGSDSYQKEQIANQGRVGEVLEEASPVRQAKLC